jgi:hypothetical protein
VQQPTKEKGTVLNALVIAIGEVIVAHSYRDHLW